jgi:molybdopterin converting factor small subunit
MAFDDNVFINCPFDEEYRPLLKSLVFELVYLGFNPKLSQTLSSSSVRINQIKGLIRSCKFGIHDLSRSKAMSKGELPRFNMPYELGLDIGALEFGSKTLKKKRILILETDRYHYQKVLSYIAGQDIENHDDYPRTLVKKVRNWFSANFQNKTLVGHTVIWVAYNQFLDDLNTNLAAEGYTEKDMQEIPIIDFIKFATAWIKEFKD